MTIDGKTLSVEELKNWIGNYFDNLRRVYSHFVNPEKKALIEQYGTDEQRGNYHDMEAELQRWNEFEQATAELIRLQGIEQGRDLKDILVDLFNLFSDEGRATEFSVKRAPAPGPVDPAIFNKPADDITDDDFFELIWVNHTYLGSTFAQEKVTVWREEIYSADREKAGNVKKKLKLIGETLSRQGRKPGQGKTYNESIPEEIVVRLHSLIYGDLVCNDRKFDGRNPMTQFRKLQEYAQTELKITLDSADMARLQAEPATDNRNGAMFTERRLLAAFLAGKILGLKTTGVLSALLKKST